MPQLKDTPIQRPQQHDTPLQSLLRLSWSGIAKRLAQSSRYLVVWFTAVPFLLFLKYMLLKAYGFPLIARYTGRGNPHALSLWQKATYFRSDLLWDLLLLPSLLWLILSLLPQRIRLLFVSLASILVVFVVFVQYRSFVSVGQFLPFSVLFAGLLWGITYVGTYTPIVDRWFLAIFFVAMAFSVFRVRKVPKSEVGVFANWGFMRFVVALCVWAVLMTALLWLPFYKFPTLPMLSGFHRNILSEAFQATWSNPKADASPPVPRETARELRERYARLVTAPSATRTFPFWKSAQGSNVILFVLETAPYRLLPLDGPLDDLPALRRLRERSFIALNHFTTYPYTIRALYSIYSGLYPSHVTEDYLVKYPKLQLPGLIASLKNAGYSTAVFAPDPPREFENVEQLYTALGFDEIHYKEIYNLPWWTWFNRASFTARLQADRAIFDSFLSYLRSSLLTQKRFAVAFEPQLGHAPWPAEIQGQRIEPIHDRGRKIFSLQDQWLERVVSELEAAGKLEETIIVFTGDHGIRTSIEDPSFVPQIDDYAFHVPLLIFAPRSVGAPVWISTPTSHIDIAPTILDLLGVTTGRHLEQGTAVWNSDISNRTLYFLAGHYFGMNGFYHQGDFVTVRHRPLFVYLREKQMSFHNVLPLDTSNALYLDSIQRLNEFLSFQREYMARIHYEQIVK